MDQFWKICVRTPVAAKKSHHQRHGHSGACPRTGANSAIFSIVNAYCCVHALWTTHRLFMLWETNLRGGLQQLPSPSRSPGL